MKTPTSLHHYYSMGVFRLYMVLRYTGYIAFSASSDSLLHPYTVRPTDSGKGELLSKSCQLTLALIFVRFGNVQRERQV